MVEESEAKTVIGSALFGHFVKKCQFWRYKVNIKNLMLFFVLGLFIVSCSGQKSNNQVNEPATDSSVNQPSKDETTSPQESEPQKDQAIQEDQKIEEIELCDLEKTKQTDQGYKCKVETEDGDVVWYLHTKTESGKKVWKDMKSGLLVSDILDGTFTHYQAQDICTHPSSLEARGNLSNITWSLPTGYPKDLNGKHGFPNEDSDFETLEDNGVLKVIDTTGSEYLWSSSVYPRDSDFAYGFYGYGDIVGGYNRDGCGYYFGSVLCVGR
ncbi:MAG: hypothetical protein HYW47_02410 [Deltaproteobacteria bacterium]|nr:hypothetical protein [Deltaproteobacteria bacterium]